MGNRSLPSDEVPPESDHMWPLDLAIVALGGSLMYMAATRLGWDDPRWIYNARTYAIAIPAGMVLIDLLLRNVASRFMQRSLQFGFLVSMFVHLVMLILAVNVVIFARYWPESVDGVQSEKTPVRKTLPDNLFQSNPNAVADQPDWSKPVDAKSEARVTPLEAQRVQRLQDVAERIEMPVKPEQQNEPTPFLMKQEQPTEAQPTPADSPSQLARQISKVMPDMRSVMKTIETPDLPSQAEQQPQALKALSTDIARSRMRGASASSPRAAPEMSEQMARSQAIAKQNMAQEAPRIAARNDAASMIRRQRQQRMTPSLSAPAVPSVSIARNVQQAPRQLADRAVGLPRRASSTMGASLAPSASQVESISAASGTTAVASPLAQRSEGSSSQPTIAGGTLGNQSPLRSRSVGRGQLSATNLGSGQVDLPNLTGQQQGDSASDGSDRNPRLAARGSSMSRSRSRDSVPAIASAPPAALAINADLGPAGLGRELAPRVGINSDQPSMQPMISVQPKMERFRRRPLGGATPPTSEKVASVEPFRKRLMRTAGGATPAPVGLVGPKTEEAIERGLAFLASRQKDDGSWSLQGQGEDVMLQSDSAATALCILAFQGAGYTHVKPPQYADTVARGLEFLKKNQRANGDLYRLEDANSNAAVWLYSHSIASLCVCEAYGMTQDPELEDVAQRAINFIVASQHPTRGGWRYRPQASSDTSVTGWMMMALKSGELAGLTVPKNTYDGIEKWVSLSQDASGTPYLFRYNPYALDNVAQRHGREVTPTMTAVGLLIRLYMGWRRDNPNMKAGAEYLLENLPEIGSARNPKRDTYYWYYATQVMFHIGGEPWKQWNGKLHPLLIRSQLKEGPENGSWDPKKPLPDRWSPHAGRLYLTTLNLLSLEVYYRNLPIYEDTAR